MRKRLEIHLTQTCFSVIILLLLRLQLHLSFEITRCFDCQDNLMDVRGDFGRLNPRWRRENDDGRREMWTRECDCTEGIFTLSR